MNFTLLWIDALLISLLWVGATLAITSRFRRRWVRSLLLAIVIGPPLAALAFCVYGASILKFISHASPSWFGYSLSLLICFIIGSAVVYWRGRRYVAGQLPAAADWSPLPLLVILLIAIGVGYMAILNMDLSIRARCAILSLKAGQEYWAAAPAVVSESQNAAPLYEQAFARLRADMGTDINSPPIGNAEKFDPNEPAVISFLQRQSKTIDMLRQAAGRPSCRFDSDIGQVNINKAISDITIERHAANVLSLDAKEALAHGNVTQAIADTRAVKRMGHQFAQRPLLVSGLVGLGIDAVSNSMLAEVLPKVSAAAQLEPLHFDDLPPLGRAYQQALRGDEQYNLSFYAGFSAWDVPPDKLSPQAMVPPAAAPMFVRVFFLDFNEYPPMMDRLKAAAMQPYFKTRDELRRMTAAPLPAGLLTRIIVPSVASSFRGLANVQAGDACAQVALAATRYRLDHGQLPARLSDLVPKYLDQIPLDPFDGKPLRLSTRDDHWIIYSIGPDQIDNGGVEAVPGTKNWDLPMALK